jgi:hypothetical protein
MVEKAKNVPSQHIASLAFYSPIPEQGVFDAEILIKNIGVKISCTTGVVMLTTRDNNHLKH